MINYIMKHFDNKLYISENFGCEIFDIPMTRLFNQLLIDELTTFQARIKTIKKRFNLKSKAPLLVNDFLLLMNIRSHRAENSLYLNFFSIYKYEIEKRNILVYFHNRHVMKIAEKYAFLEQYKRCENILKEIWLQENVFIYINQTFN